MGGATLHVTCNDGFYLDGETTIQCDGDSGEYKPAAPTCKACTKGCLQCTAAGLDADICQACDKSLSYDWDDDATVCTLFDCVIHAPTNNWARGLTPSVDSECYTQAPHFLMAAMLTDGIYVQPDSTGRYTPAGYVGRDRGFYHSCPNRPGGDEVRLYLANAKKVATVRVFLRCDGLTDRLVGATIWAQQLDTRWVQCGEPFGTAEDAANCGGSMRTCDLRKAAEEQYLDRDCGGEQATAVKLVQGRPVAGQNAEPLNVPELEIYSC